MPACAALRIIWQMSSISRSRSGLLPSMMFGILERLDLVRAERQRHHVERHAERLDALAQPRAAPRPTSCRRDFADGSRLQMWFTPKPAIARRISSESPCCGADFHQRFAGRTRCLRLPRAGLRRPPLPPPGPTPARRTKSLRSIMARLYWRTMRALLLLFALSAVAAPAGLGANTGQRRPNGTDRSTSTSSTSKAARRR